MNLPLKVLITGTNKGIGNELVKAFLRFNPNAEIFATSRQKNEVASQRWKGIDLKNQVRHKYLDVTSMPNILDLARQFQKENVKIDILINNAGVSRTSQLFKPIPDLDFARQCLNVNILGPINLTQQLIPFLSDTCKIVNISSLYGGLKFHPQKTQQKFSDPNLTRQDILDAVNQYIAEVENKKLVNFSSNVYAASKMLLGAWSRFILQKYLKEKQISICVTPGLCLTSMTEDFDEKIKAKAHSAESGALKIHQTIFFNDLNSNVFYHRARKSNFVTNGQELPWQ